MPDRAAVRKQLEAFDETPPDMRWDALRAKGWTLDVSLAMVIARKGHVSVTIRPFDLLSNESLAFALNTMEAEEAEYARQSAS